MPNIPNINPDITITWTECISMLLASIALEEMGQAHVINAEAEKLQYILGTLGSKAPLDPPTIDQLLAVNDSICMTLRNVCMNNMMLSYKLQDAINLYGQG